MSKRTDIKTILIIGSGPIVIGQACEFDYSGTQACKALKEEGYKVVLVNSNPATIMTDPDFADVTYIEPLTPEVLEKIIAKERPDALLPTLGGQTGLNLSLELAKRGILAKYGVELIGAKQEAIEKGEDRQLFREAMMKIGLDIPQSVVVHELKEAIEWIEKWNKFPVIIRPSFTLGGTGGGIAYNREEYEKMVAFGLSASPVSEVLVEECLLGWKEFEMEVMRDHKDQCVVICSIENLDPMGVHTGDSITVAPALTLTDKEYQLMRDASFAVIREIGVETGGSNIQFAVNPENGRMIVIEMNPRVSRSSALASKATGFPIAKIAAKLAVGYSLDELRNDITRETPASFEPTIDYVVTKIPRFTFEKFAGSDNTLTSSMKSVGEAMAIGRTFKESLQKALRSMEIGTRGLGGGGKFGGDEITDHDEIRKGLVRPTAERIFYVRYAIKAGFTDAEIHEFTAIDPWFLKQIRGIVEIEEELASAGLLNLSEDLLRRAKEAGFSDKQIAHLCATKIRNIKQLRQQYGIETVFRLVDTCAAEFEAFTPYYYSTYGVESELRPSTKKKIMIIGGGPNRIGQGIEFDYCCVHASKALRADGWETIMVNCNPETVSTDFDTSDRLYFEPVTLEDVLAICEVEKPAGVIVQYGGQTPLKLCRALEAAGVPIIGTTPDAIDCAEDRERFQHLLQKLNLRQPPNRTARTEEDAIRLAAEIGYPLVVRPSYVLGGRAMDIVHTPEALQRYMKEAVSVSNESPVLLDRFLDDAVEMDVDAVADGHEVQVAGVMEHIEQAGVHSGDSACSLPPYSLPAVVVEEIKRQTKLMAEALNVVGLMNVQFAVQHAHSENPVIYVLEVNPRASRTVPFVSKATGNPVAAIAARVMAGQTLAEQGVNLEVTPRYVSVKEAVFPFSKFLGVDPVLGPEMRSTGEVMGVGRDFGEALFKSQLAAGSRLPERGSVFISVRECDKPKAVVCAHQLHQAGFPLVATAGTAHVIQQAGIPCRTVGRIGDAAGDVIGMMEAGDITLVIMSVAEHEGELNDARAIRKLALAKQITYYTTMAGGLAASEGIRHMRSVQVYDLQGLHAGTLP